MFYAGLVIHCKDAGQWNTLLKMLEDSGYIWCTGRKVFEERGVDYNPDCHSFICIHNSAHAEWPPKSFFMRGLNDIGDKDMALYNNPIEFEDFLSPVPMEVGDLI